MVRIVLWCFTTILLLAPQLLHAGVALNTTRVIIDSGKKEASFSVQNMGDYTLVQSWLEAHDGDETVKHFTLTPQLVGVKAASEQRVRILYEGVGAPPNRESMFWLHVQEIPQKPKQDGVLQIAVQHRIKVFYRPAGLPGKPIDAARKIVWTYSNGKLSLANPTAFHVTLVNLEIHGKSFSNSVVIAPGKHLTIAPVNGAASGLNANSKISFASVNDYGARDPYRVDLSGDKPVLGVAASR